MKARTLTVPDRPLVATGHAPGKTLALDALASLVHNSDQILKLSKSVPFSHPRRDRRRAAVLPEEVELMAYDAGQHPLLKPGDKIRLNATAREWARGKVFTVSAIESWGVICSTTADGYGDASERKSLPHTTRASGNLAFYRAAWDEIEELV